MTSPHPAGHAPRLTGPLPLLGDYVALRRDPLALVHRAVRECGPITRLALGHLTAHVVVAPELVRQVLQEKHKNYAKQSVGYRKLRAFLGNGLLTSEGAFWLRQRRIMQPAFHRARINALAGDMAAAAERCAERWEPLARAQTPIDVSSEMMRTTLEIVGTTLFGTDVRNDSQAVGRAMTTLLEEFQRRIRLPFELPRSWPTPGNRRLDEATRVVDGVVSRAIDQRRSNPAGAEQRHDLLTLLLEARDEETGEGMSPAQLRDEVATLFAAGHETTANALSWAFVLLSQHPAVARALRAELARVLAGRTPTADDYAALPYTRAVVQETLRLYPPAWLMGRLAVEDDTLGGFHIPAGSLVFVSPWATHRVPALWPNPEGFDPERFLGDAAESRPPFAYFPFGGGPRVCIGNHFAMLESVLVLATLAQRFQVDLRPGVRAEPEAMVTLRPRGGLPATLHALTVARS